MSTHVSTLWLHQYRYGELAEDQRRLVDSHLERCDRCRRRLQAQLQQREEFVLQPVPQALLDAASPAPAGPWARLRPWLTPGVALAAAAALFVAVPIAREAAAPQTVQDERVKGDLPLLEVWVEGDRGPRLLGTGETLHAGDRVQLVFDPRGAALVTLAGRDGAGTLEIWGAVVTRDEPRGLRPAPFALTLDDAPGPQEFFVVTSSVPLDDSHVRRAIEAVHRPNGIEVLSVAVPKE